MAVRRTLDLDEEIVEAFEQCGITEYGDPPAAAHRGQIMLRARELGHEFTSDDVMRIWGWKKLR